MTPSSRSNLSSLALDVHRIKRALSFPIRPLNMLAEDTLVDFSSTPYELTVTLFEEPLHSCRPCAFELIGGSFQGYPQTSIVRSSA